MFADVLIGIIGVRRYIRYTRTVGRSYATPHLSGELQLWSVGFGICRRKGHYERHLHIFVTRKVDFQQESQPAQESQDPDISKVTFREKPNL